MAQVSRKRLLLLEVAVVALLWGLISLLGGPGQPEANEAPDGVDPAWWAQAQRRIMAAEYEISWQEQTVLSDLLAAWQAPNREHDFRTYFADEGIRLVPRQEDAPSWQLELSLVGYGRGESTLPVGPASLSSSGNRIEYRRTSITEWYVNDRRGLEQGFTLTAPPEDIDGAEHSTAFGPMHLDLVLGGDLSPRLSADGQLIDFTAPGGEAVLRYDRLKVYDASGRLLNSRMEVFNDGGLRRIRLIANDRGAVYPVTIDPLMTTPSWIGEGSQVSALYGGCVGTAGDVNSDGFSDLIVGAPGFDNGQSEEGRAYVYHGSASGPSINADWTAEGDQVGAFFGCSAGTAGDVNGDGYSDVIVGAPGFNNGETDEGQAYVYRGSAVGLSATPSWIVEGDQASAGLGEAVATAGDVNGDGYSDIIVGARLFDNPENDEGKAWVYRGSSSGLSTTPSWTAESDQAGAQFGIEVDTAGDVNGDGYADIIVSANRYTNVEGTEGQALVYHGSSSGLSSSANWTVESNQVHAQLSAVATAGDVNGDGYSDVVVGALRFDNPETTEGKVWVYRGSAGGLSTTASWTAEGDQLGAGLGSTVSSAGDVDGDGYGDIIVGAASFDNGSGNDLVTAFVYQGSATGLSTIADWMVSGGVDGVVFSVGLAGDVNGDGYSDVVVGSPYEDVDTGAPAPAAVFPGSSNGLSSQPSWATGIPRAAGAAGRAPYIDLGEGGLGTDPYTDVVAGGAVLDNAGIAWVYDGSSAGLNTSTGWTAESDQEDSEYGFAVSTAGDVNGDGYADLIVGASMFDNGESNEGMTFVYHGSASGPSATADWTAESNQADARFGHSVSSAGDVNGDGYDDVIVGALDYTNVEFDEGRAFVYHGSASGLSVSEDWTAEIDQDEAQFGGSVSSAGDVNGDGFAEVIVGALNYDNGESQEGAAFVYHGSIGGLSASADWMVEGDLNDARLGRAVGTAGDVNGDGYSEVIVGATGYDNPENAEGKAWVYRGSSSGLSTTSSWTAEGNQAGAFFGSTVSSAGDVNRDGFSDVVVGAEGYDNPEVDEGAAFVYHGSSGGLSTVANWTGESDQAGAKYGRGATAGDVNGDGYADLIVGAREFDNEGAAFGYHGSAAGLSTVADWTITSGQGGALMGRTAVSAGDVNGDGYADVVVGAADYDNDTTNEGRIFVHYGNEGPNLSIVPRQRRSDDAGPIARLGASDSPTSFRLALLGRTPFGRGRVKLEWEVKSLGSLFDGLSTETSASWMDTGTAGVALNELASGLATDGVYHWRVRVLYDPITTPFQPAGPWLTMPWNGMEEADLLLGTLSASPAGIVPTTLRIGKAGGITLIWDASCKSADTDYEVYGGDVGDFTTHEPLFCTTGGLTTKALVPLSGARYYLVVPRNAGREGSYGTDSLGAERPQSVSACLIRTVGACD